MTEIEKLRLFFLLFFCSVSSLCLIVVVLLAAVVLVDGSHWSAGAVIVAFAVVIFVACRVESQVQPDPTTMPFAKPVLTGVKQLNEIYKGLVTEAEGKLRRRFLHMRQRRWILPRIRCLMQNGRRHLFSLLNSKRTVTPVTGHTRENEKSYACIMHTRWPLRFSFAPSHRLLKILPED